jgi:nucleotide-binding universal stress UspA family protein
MREVNPAQREHPMSYKALLVYADTTEEGGVRVAATLDLAARLGALVIGVSAGMTRPVVDPYFGAAAGIALESEREQLDAELKAAEARFRDLATKAAVKHEFRTPSDFPSDALIKTASAADLIIAGHRKSGFESDSYSQVASGDVVMGSGRPVLVVPPNVAAITGRRVLIAWKNTREARRAVTDALPFLRLAETVVAIEVSEDKAGADQDLADLRAYLERHSIALTTRSVSPGKDAAEHGLLDFGRKEGADLIVAGGYGHARTREWMFGGVTRALLAGCPLPVLLSH